MKKIASFTINHDLLQPGMYISRIDGDCVTYDLRMKVPNAGDYLDQKGLHTLEHLLATYLRNSDRSDSVIYTGPMGCRTGFYLVMRDAVPAGEAVQLVLTSGAFARDGELFVLDMGRPVKILDLAESMIRLSGFEPYKDIDIIETGLRPGEKLYEELLVNKDEMTKTSNEKIFIETDTVPSREEIASALEKLEAACDTCDDETVRRTLQEIVPSFKPAK